MTTQNESGNIILDSIADGVFTVDGQFRITYMNRAAEDILGIRRDEAMDKICYEVFHASICEHSCALRETMETGRNVINRTIFIVNADGRRLPDNPGRLLPHTMDFSDLRP
jgi:PAS domain S-box-containing protein